MEEITENLVKRIIRKPELMTIDKYEDERTIRFSISVDEDDKGLILGKKGNNIRALKIVLGAICKKFSISEEEILKYIELKGLICNQQKE